MSFYFAYTGSKRLDYKFMRDYINLDNINKIVEPFCGSSAFSFLSQNDNIKEYVLTNY